MVYDPKVITETKKPLLEGFYENSVLEICVLRHRFKYLKNRWEKIMAKLRLLFS